ncbi:MAG TPA: preprotein translocase subunit SecY [Terrimicrobiaceae bacterium]|jgi:preprotein translocase subunit SecY|nr:preprotein translocase subunit SecY [Terrimicrobiaceae bacterium]
MISAFTNIFKIPELRQRVLFTLAMIVIIRAGSAITTPGVNAEILREWFRNVADAQSAGGIASLFNLFSGGALAHCAIFSLGIMPYISASIMMQLLTAVVPQLGKLAREDGGRRKIMQYTRYATIALCIFQGYLLARSFENPQANPFLPGIMDTINRLGLDLVPEPGVAFQLMTIITMTAGTMFLMWMGDQITERGIGNGVSLVITVGILAQLPAGLIQAWRTFVPTAAGAQANVSPIVLVLLCLFLVLVIAAVIAVTQAQRKISIQYAKRVVGRKVYGGQTQYMPLKINYAGVMPIIFAQAILLFPSTIINMAFPQSRTAQEIANLLAVGWLHYVLYAAMIFFFSYFWVATQFQPVQIADDLKKYGGFIPGVRPGKPTADFLDFTMSRLTFAGAVFLTVIAVLPQLLAQALKVPYMTAQFFGGTGVLIIVGVVLDTMRQVETHLLQRHYDGFLRKGRIRGAREQRPRLGSGQVLNDSSLVLIYASLGILVIAGVTIFFATRR